MGGRRRGRERAQTPECRQCLQMALATYFLHPVIGMQCHHLHGSTIHDTLEKRERYEKKEGIEEREADR